MEKIVLLCFLPFVLGSYYEENYEAIKKELEGVELTWEHGMHDTFRKLSKEQLRQMLGSIPNEADYKAAPAEEVELLDETDIPKEFDARQQWPYCRSIRLIRDQANCGSCWAVSAASVMSDRVCIATYGIVQPYISDENILSCCTSGGHGCHGGDPLSAFKYWKQGIPNGGPYNTTNGCQPYTKCWEGCPGGTPACMGHKCIPEFPYSYNSSLYYGATWYWIQSMERAQQDIMKYGPIDATFHVYEDLYYYKSGVYKHTTGKHEGSHAVRVIGWGEENGVPYWLITNSWGPYWGDNGLFKILRGQDECAIESYLTTGTSTL